MANREKGEVALVLGDRQFTLVHNHHAIALLQHHFSTDDEVASVFVLDKKIREGSLIHQEALLWAMLQKHHAEDFPTVQEASDLIDRDGLTVGKALREALGWGAPDPADIKEIQEAQTANPPAARPRRQARRVNGTGASASSARAASA